MSKCRSFKVQILKCVKRAWELLISRSVLRENKPGDPSFLLFQYVSYMERRHHTKIKKILAEELYATHKLPFLTFIKNLSARKFLK